jgi:hypothetical protein
MKKFDLIHTTVLIVAILSGYVALQYVIAVISSLAYFATPGGHSTGGMSGTVLAKYVIMAVVSAIACYVLIRNGHRYTVLILKEDPEALLDDAPKWDIDRRNIILILFIGIGLHTLIQNLPSAVVDLYELFSRKIGGYDTAPKLGYPAALDLLRITIGTFLIYAAPNLTDFIEKNITARPDGPTQPRQNV